MDANQLWVRNANGQVWGPLPPKQILLLLERQLISGVTEASRDGRRYSPAAQEPALAPALAKLTPAAEARPRTVSGMHEVWRPTTGTIPVQGGAPARSSASVPGGVARTPVAGVPATPGAPRVSTPMQPLAAAIAAHIPPAPTIIQAVPPAGRLEEHSPFKLYYLIAAAETQGRLVLGEGQTAVSVWFKSGTPHAIESQALGLGPYLIEQRVLTAAQLASAQPQIQKSGGDVASGLFTAGLLNPQTAFPMIQQHAQTLLQRGLLLDHGPFAFDPSVPVPASGFQLGQRWQLLSGAARRLDTIRLRTWLHGREHLIPQVAGSTSELQLTAQETRLLTHVDGGRTLAVALTLAGPQSDSLLRLMLLLTEIDRVTWTGAAGAPGVLPPVTRRTTSVAREAAPPTAAPPQAARRTSSVALEAPVPTGAGAQTVRRTTSVIREPGAAPVISPAPPVAPRVAAPVAPPPKPAPAATGGLSGAIAKAMAENAAPKTAPAPAPSAAAPKPVAAAPGARPATVAPKPAVPAAKPAATLAAKPAGAPIKTAPGQGGNLNLPALAKFLEELKAKDFFARLKVERSQAPIAMLKSNYFQLAKLYHPDTVPPDGPEEARRMKADILALLNEANGVLSDDAKRIDYLAETEAREALGDVDVEAVLMAEEDFQQAILLTRARKFTEALALIEKCIKANAKEGEFYAWRGYCRFFGSQDKRSFRDMAIEDQKKALSLNPKCTVAWLFQGQIWKLLEDVPKAKEAFQKTLELDPNNVDAQRELRLFEQRKK